METPPTASSFTTTQIAAAADRLIGNERVPEGLATRVTFVDGDVVAPAAQGAQRDGGASCALQAM